MKNIIITGASGLVGTELTLRLIEERAEANIYLISSNPSKLSQRYGDSQHIKCFDLKEFEHFCSCNEIEYDCLIHTAFTRTNSGSDIASSLAYLQRVLDLAKSIGVASFINISSQSVYGKRPLPWTEESAVDPDSLYALAKYSSEIIVDESLKDSQINYTNIRLSSVCEKARFINVFAKNACEGKPIKIVGGQQSFSFIDVRDVASALISVIDNVEKIKFDKIYNLANNIHFTLLQAAECVVETGVEKYNLQAVPLEIEASDVRTEAGMDGTKFMTAFTWKPQFGLADMVESLYEFNLCKRNMPKSWISIYKL